MGHEEGLQAMKCYFIKHTETILFHWLHCENYKVDFRGQCMQKQLYRHWWNPGERSRLGQIVCIVEVWTVKDCSGGLRSLKFLRCLWCRHHEFLDFHQYLKKSTCRSLNLSLAGAVTMNKSTSLE